MAGNIITYNGVRIEVWEQSIKCDPGGGATPHWLKRPVEDPDIEAVKRYIDAGRASMAREIRELRKQEDELLGEH